MRTHRDAQWVRAPRVPLKKYYEDMQAMKAVTEGHTMRKHGANGFSLIELMIAVAIIGILAALAYPSYTRYVAETRRSDATINLTRIAALQEKFYTQCGRYADDLTGANINCPGPLGLTATLNANLAAGNVTRDGHYTITVVVAPGPGGAAGGGGFILTAQPNNIPGLTRQRDLDFAFCNTFTINQAGVKTALGSDSLILGPNGGKCWRK
jgi:type IV pilus assembly protein PilE